MVFERGPQAFIDEAIQLTREYIAGGSSMQQLSHSASTHIHERISILTSLRCSLATFLAKVCIKFCLAEIILFYLEDDGFQICS